MNERTFRRWRKARVRVSYDTEVYVDTLTNRTEKEQRQEAKRIALDALYYVCYMAKEDVLEFPRNKTDGNVKVRFLK